MAEIGRSLTGGELRYTIEVFGADLDYRQVLVHNYKAFFFQPSDTAMTPNGEIYFPPQSYKPDFSFTISDAAWLIHELTHCWQHQKGMWVRLRAIFNRTYEYGSLAGNMRSFLTYSVEQQAAIVADYFRVAHGAAPVEGAGALEDYRRVIPFVTAGR